MPASWSSSLKQVLSSLPASNNSGLTPTQSQPRVAVVGIGNEFNGDDCAGPLIARKLIARVTPRENILIVDAGTAPENITGSLRSFPAAIWWCSSMRWIWASR